MSGDECIVALNDQWCITYGEPEWKEKETNFLTNMELYYDESKHGFKHKLSWINQWACSISIGLGTKI